jgi:hypothetical protein
MGTNKKLKIDSCCRLVPYLIPLSHMAVMVSNFCTGIMGFER